MKGTHFTTTNLDFGEWEQVLGCEFTTALLEQRNVRLKYRADIDGLRAIAVLSVMFYHADLGLSGGYVGVDIFFVISGYLITSILRRQIEEKTFSLRGFYERRIRRLVPALLVVTLATSLLGCVVLLPQHLNDLGGALISQPLLLANVYYWGVVKFGYFTSSPEVRPLLNTWSLGVEEQFYLFFPIILLGLCKLFRSQRKIGASLAVITGLSLAASILFTPQMRSFAFFNLPTRAWELGLGCLLCFLPGPPRSLREWLGLAGAIITLFSVFKFQEDPNFPGYVALIPCLGAGLIIWSNTQEPLNLVGEVLSKPILVSIGLASYSLYLWHWPIFAFPAYLGIFDSLAGRLLLLLTCFPVGWLSWKYIETPYRSSKCGSSRETIRLMICYILLCCGFGLILRANRGFPAIWDKTALDYMAIQRDYVSTISTDVKLTSQVSPASIGDIEQPRSRFLLFGDSHARNLVPVLDKLGRDSQVRGVQFTRSARAPVFSGVEDAWTTRLRDVIVSEDISVVFIGAYWNRYRLSSKRIEDTIEILKSMGITQVVLVDDIPALQCDPPRPLALATRFPFVHPDLSQPSEHYEKNEQTRTELRRVSRDQGVRIIHIDPAPLLLKRNLPLDQGELLYADRHHLSRRGSLLLEKAFSPIFREF